MTDMEYENPVYEEDVNNDDINENRLTTDTVFEQDRQDENNAATGFTFGKSDQVHAEREEYSDEIAEIAKKESREKDAFINQLEIYFKQKLNGDRVYLKERIIKKNGAWFFMPEDGKNPLQLTYINEIKSSGKKAGDVKNLETLKSYNKKAVAELEKIFEKVATTVTPSIPKEIGLRQKQVAQRNLGIELNQADAGENIELIENVVRKRPLNYKQIEPTMADQQRIFEALRDVDIVEFVQEPRGENIEIDIQLKNAKQYKFKLKQFEANLKSAKEHKNEDWIHDMKKEIESIELHLKTIAGKLARLYADKFYDSNLSWPTRLRYFIKLKGFKIGVIVSAIGISFSALIAGLIETFTPAANVVLKKAGDVVKKVAEDVIVPIVKKAGDVIVPIVNNAYENIIEFVKRIIEYIIKFVKKIIEYIGAVIVWIGKNIIEYMFEHIIILIGVIVLMILSIAMSRSKK